MDCRRAPHVTGNVATMPHPRRPMTIGTITLIALIMITGVIIGRRTRREIRAEEAQILQGVRKVCKLSTVELQLADYTKKTVPKTIVLTPFGRDFCEAALALDGSREEPPPAEN